MNRRDFLAGAATGATSAGVIAIAGRAVFDRPAPKGTATAVTTKPTQAPPTTPAPAGRPPNAAPPVTTDYKGRVSFAQEGEDLIIYDLLYQVLKLKNPSYLDIGAGDPVLGNNTYVLYGTGSRGVLVEPNPTLTEKLKSVRQGDVVVNAGVGIKDTSEADYYVIRGQWPLNTFSLKDVALLRKQYKEDLVEKVIRMPLIQINRLIAEHFQTAPDLLSIDIEGMDLDVLKSMNFKAHRPAAICAETKKPWESHDNTAIARFLRTKGYVPCAGSLYNTIFADRRRLPAARRRSWAHAA
jgi:FkbM family methyltransferase